MQTDPIGYEDQMNLYAYVHNDPMKFTDPSGMSSCYSATHGFGTVCAGPALLAGMKSEEQSSSAQEHGVSGPGKWRTTDVDRKGLRNSGQMIATRSRTLGQRGRLWGSEGEDYEGTVRDVTQTWEALTTTEAQGLKENGFISVERMYGETRVIRQMFLEGGDGWKTIGKSWYWQPVVPNTVFEFKEP